MATLNQISTIVPSHKYDKRQIIEITQAWLKGDKYKRELFERFVGSCKIDNRNFSLPLEKILELGGSQTRAEIFGREGRALAEKCLVLALEQSGLDPRDLCALLFTSCSVPMIPSIDVGLIHSLGLRPDILRIPMYQHGCAGGAVALAIAERLASSEGAVAVLSVELCSLGFHSEDISSGSILGSALFADGAACAIVQNSGVGLKYLASKSYIIPESQHLMGYDIYDDGAHLRLDKELPSALSSAIDSMLPSFLSSLGLIPAEIAWWLFHPGGSRILEILENKFSLRPEQARWSWEILHDFGNMSSATILFVASKFMNEAKGERGDKVLLFGVGPGLILQCIVFEVV